MFDDEESTLKRKAGLPLLLENLSVNELDSYTALLHEEIKRVEAERERKQRLRASAEHFFKQTGKSDHE